MGLHYVFGYVNYELDFLDTFIRLLDAFCSSCHTNDDVGDCYVCPIGVLVYASKKYILDVNVYKDDDEKESALINLIK